MTTNKITLLLLALAGLAETPVSAAAPSNVAPRAVDVGSRKQLFVDRHLVESSRDVTLSMHSPRRDGRVLITADQPWEKDCHVLVYSSVVKDRGKIRVWYDLIKRTGAGPYDHLRMVAYAESADGVHFVKPKLGLHALEGSKQNNIVLPDKIGGCAVWIDSRAPAEHRYKTQAKVYPTGQFTCTVHPTG